jgi:hypothetical protein
MKAPRAEYWFEAREEAGLKADRAYVEARASGASEDEAHDVWHDVFESHMSDAREWAPL